jgi:DNA-binding IclR family transcriptional regulator
MKQQLDPAHIMQSATAFWASKVLLTAAELELFTMLGDESMTAQQLGNKLQLHPRGTYDFFDALVALKFLERNGEGKSGRYKNTLKLALS